MWDLLVWTVEWGRRLSSCLFILYGFWPFKRKSRPPHGKPVAQWWLHLWVRSGCGPAVFLVLRWDILWSECSWTLKAENIVPSYRSPLRLPSGKCEEALNPVPTLRLWSANTSQARGASTGGLQEGSTLLTLIYSQYWFRIARFGLLLSKLNLGNAFRKT